jgi:hypothetical protein
MYSAASTYHLSKCRYLQLVRFTSLLYDTQYLLSVRHDRFKPFLAGLTRFIQADESWLVSGLESACLGLVSLILISNIGGETRNDSMRTPLSRSPEFESCLNWDEGMPMVLLLL